MGEVICVYKVLPDSPESFDKVKDLLEAMQPARLEEEPIAFGLKALIFTKIIPDGEGVLEDLENKLNDLDGVGSVENSPHRGHSGLFWAAQLHQQPFEPPPLPALVHRRAGRTPSDRAAGGTAGDHPPGVVSLTSP